ncbi:hypothetical protein DIPPA_20198 [Diplonema papillatum]|nr:hypothetical protein DIPPA_20198 [Diplonema papillatum]
MPPKQQNVPSAEDLAQLEKRLIELEQRLAVRESEVEAAEKRKREQDEAEREAKKPRRELPEEGGKQPIPAEIMPGLPINRAEEIFLAFQDDDPSFWESLRRELCGLEDEREVLAVLDEAAAAVHQVVDDDASDDDFALVDPEHWKTMSPTSANLRRFEDAVRRLYRFKGNQALQDRRDDITEKVRDLVRLRRGESGPPKLMWLLRLGALFDEYEQVHAVYELRDPGAAGAMRQIQQVDRLPERVRQARRRLTAQFKAKPTLRPPLARGGPAAREACRNFKNGRCMRTDCRFRHAAPHAPSRAMRRVPSKND